MSYNAHLSNLSHLFIYQKILLHGPPGCAKTTLARAAAGAAGIAFISYSPADVRYLVLYFIVICNALPNIHSFSIIEL